ncbi:MAG: S1C family serine protease [Candidatus Hydrogenedentota bacterium]
MQNRQYLFLRALACCLAFLVLPDANAQSNVDATRRNAIVRAIEKVAPAVVTIDLVDVRTERVYEPHLRDFFRGFGYRGGRAPRLRRRAVESLGTGFCIDAEGHILTNHHVVQGADYGTVTWPDGREMPFEFVGMDERTDLAVLKVSRESGDESIPHVRLGSSEDLMVGEWVIAIGNPFGAMMDDPQPSVSVGVVSANHRRVRREIAGGTRHYQDMIQTDAAINPGNSGGPLVNAMGEVVGVSTLIFSSSGGHQGLGFAIPIDRVERVVQEVIEYGRRRSPWLGFRGEAVRHINPYTRHELDVKVEQGVLVTELLRDSPAYRAGLRVGDVITQMNGASIHLPEDIDYVTWGLFMGDTVTVVFNRQGETQSIEFEVTELSP